MAKQASASALGDYAIVAGVNLEKAPLAVLERLHVSAASRWWDMLDQDERERVREWLSRNPPPRDWRGSHIEWAYTEGPARATGEKALTASTDR